MIDEPSDDFDLQGWPEMILGLGCVSRGALGLFDGPLLAEARNRAGAADEAEELVDFLLGVQVLAQRVAGAVSRFEDDGAKRTAPDAGGPLASPEDGWLR